MSTQNNQDKDQVLNPGEPNKRSRPGLGVEADELYAMRHSLAHIMATAVEELWAEAKLGVGPVIENGFYYDVDLGETKISEEDFTKIESKMQEIIKADQPFECFEMPIDEAVEWAKEAKQPYKQELLNDLKEHGTTVMKDIDASSLGVESSSRRTSSNNEGENQNSESGEDAGSEASKVSGQMSNVTQVSFYRNGPFTDLCRGPHVESTGKVGAFKLMKVAGAYWRGKETNPQMQRLYGVAFATKEELKSYLETMEEAKKRDHRKLGQELDLFTFSDLVGPGLPLYTPRGTVLIEELKKVLREISNRYDMLLVSIPHIAKIELYQTSGHADKFSDELFHVKSHYDQPFVMKPVNCPHHTQIYAARPRSYRELPLRYIEQTMQYRDEKPGQIGGLQRTRGFTVDDGHTFCRVDQIEQEASMSVEVIKDFYTNLGLWGEHWVSLSVREPGAQDKYIGLSEDWDKAESMLDEVSTKYGLNAKRMEGEAAIYGPKLDFMFKDALGRETQLATVQLDFAMPKRFGLTYTDENSELIPPVMIHRAILGSFERFIMLLIEHFAGKFPVWLAPEQIRVATVNDSKKLEDYARVLVKDMKEAGLRAELDLSNESVGKKIRAAELYKVPYTLVVGEKELESGKVTPRVRKDLATSEPSELEVDKFIQVVAGEAKSRASKASL